MRLVALLLVAGCRLSFEDLGRGATVDANRDSDASDDVLVLAAPRAVQSTSLLSIDAFTANVVTFPSPTTAGNTIVAYSWTWSSQGSCLVAPSDSVGNTYTEARIRSLGSTCAGGTGEVAIHIASAISPSATHTITLNRTAGDNTAQYALVAVEYEGVTAVVSSNSAIATNVSPVTFGTDVMTTQPNALIVSAATICGGYPDDVAWTPPDVVIRGQEPRTAFVAPGAGGDFIAPLAGTQTATWSVAFTDTMVPVIAVAAALQ